MLFARLRASAICRTVLGGSLLYRRAGSSVVRVVDMRSDVLTKPTPVILQAMTQSTLDDDVFQEDQTTNTLEAKMAEVFGKESALFVLSGTMGNLIGVSCHCPSRGLEVLLGDKSHVHLWEQGGISQFSGLHARSIPNLADGTLNLDVLDEYIRPRDDPHQPFTGLVVVENTHNYCGGKVLPLDFLTRLKAKALQHGIPVHMDGARIMNAAVALGLSLKEVCKDVDSISVCFSKGIGAPVGSVLVGSAEFIARARRMRKALGGGWRKSGPLAAGVLAALEDAPARIKKDHDHAKRFATAIKANAKGVLDVDVDGVHTNIIMVRVVKSGLTPKELCRRLEMVTDEETAELHEKIIVRVNPARVPQHVRVCTMSNLSTDHVGLALKKWLHVVNEYRKLSRNY